MSCTSVKRMYPVLTGILWIKLFFIGWLIVLMIINLMYWNPRHLITQYPSVEWKSFSYETISIALLAGFSSVWIAWMRQKSLNTHITAFVITCGVLIAFNLLFQYSGVYLYIYSIHSPSIQDMIWWPPVNHILVYAGLIILGISIVGCILLSLLPSTSTSTSFQYRHLFGGRRWIEAIVFALCYSLPVLWMSYPRLSFAHVETSQRNAFIGKTWVITFITCLVLFFILEAVGFWQSVGLGVYSRRLIAPKTPPM